MNNNPPATILNDEIDLRTLWATLVKRKLAILAITVTATLLTGMYAWTLTPVYSGKVLIEVGSFVLNNNPVNDKPTIIQSLDNIGDLKEIIIQVIEVNATKKEKMTLNTPQGSSNLIEISFESPDKQQIAKKLDEASTFILNRHHEKANLYTNEDSKIRVTQIIGKINVGNGPIKPNKQSIILSGLLGGLVLGIFMAFFLELIQRMRTPKE